MSERVYIDFKEVKERVALPEVLEKFDLLDKFKRKGDKLTGLCPLPCHKHTSPKPNDQQFKIDRGKGDWLWHCFGDCNKGGDVIAFVREMKGYDNAQVRFWFAEHFGDRLTLTRPRDKAKPGSEGEPPSDKPEPTSEETSVAESSLKPLRFYLNLDANMAMSYLSGRGLDQETVKRYGVGLCSKGVLIGYVAIPVYRYPKAKSDEYPVGYVGRWPGDDFDGDQPRYKVPGWETSKAVFGIEQALALGDESKPLLLVEGPLKAMWLVQRGFRAGSSFTASVSDDQADILVSLHRPIVLAFDGNEAGLGGMRTGAARLITRSFVQVVKLPEGKEPDQLSDKELELYYGFVR